MGTRLGHEIWVNSQAFQVERHAPAAPAHMHDPPSGPSPWMTLVFVLGPEAPGEPGHSSPSWKDPPPGWGGPVLCSCPRPQALAEATAQAGKHYLGLRQGLTLPGWFFAGMAGGEGKGSEKGHLGSMRCLSPTPETLRPPTPASQSCCQGDFEQGAPAVTHRVTWARKALLIHRRADNPTMEHACFWATKILTLKRSLS